MQGGAKTAQEEMRRAMALTRRLSRAATGLFDTLARVEARLTRPEKIDSLIAPFQTPDALVRLLSSTSKADSASLKPRAISPEPPLRALSKPPSATEMDRQAQKRADTAPDPHTPRISKPTPTLPKASSAHKTAEDAARERKMSAKEQVAAAPRKPATLREIADMRRAQRQTHQPDKPLPFSEAQAEGSDLPDRTLRKASETDTTHRTKSRYRSLHPLAALAATQAKAVSDIISAERQTQTDPPLTDRIISTAASPDVSTGATDNSTQPGLPDANETGNRAAASDISSPTQVNQPDVRIPAAPQSGRGPGPTGTTSRRPGTVQDDRALSEAAWRNGVEPQ